MKWIKSDINLKEDPIQKIFQAIILKKKNKADQTSSEVNIELSVCSSFIVLPDGGALVFPCSGYCVHNVLCRMKQSNELKAV